MPFRPLVQAKDLDVRISDDSPLWRFLEPRHSDATPGHDGTRAGEIIHGSASHDVIFGDGGNDFIFAKAGNDRISVAGNPLDGQATQVFAGTGHDTVTIEARAHGEFDIYVDSGCDTVWVKGGDVVDIYDNDIGDTGIAAHDGFVFTETFRGDATIHNLDPGSDSIQFLGNWHRAQYNLFVNQDNGASVQVVESGTYIPNVQVNRGDGWIDL